jgi:S-adenosylmethionine hydrolase
MNQPPVIALLTDFGLSDPYVGIMKGVLLSKAPTAQLVDLTHEVPPQSVSEASFLLQTAWRFFPAGTIFLVVVDPGVGSSRGRIAVRAHGMTFIAPDNGCLSSVLSDDERGYRAVDEGYDARTVPLSASVTAVSIENTYLFCSTVSATFEGRDVFAPAAGWLAAGGSFSDLGPSVQGMQSFPAFRAPRDHAAAPLQPDGGHAYLHGLVIHIDTYGNLITDIRAEDVSPEMRFIARGVPISQVRTYADAAPEMPVAIIGSSGYVEIAVPNGSAADRLQASVGDAVAELT